VAATAFDNFQAIAEELVRVSRGFYQRGWVLGTSGNFSAVVERDPFQLAISRSGMDKGELTAQQILLINDAANVLSNHPHKPSDETPLHLMLVKQRQAGAVLHTHSVWSTILSDLHTAEGGLTIEGYEMLKGLAGVTTHEHREWLPIFENSQDMNALAEQISGVLADHPRAHGFLLRRHGLYTWGSTLAQAKRHVEILEFLLEASGRARMMREDVARAPRL
jgi:methylthioribulose-1-phosphate dehydratase